MGLFRLLLSALLLAAPPSFAGGIYGVTREIWTGLSPSEQGFPAGAAFTGAPANAIYRRQLDRFEGEVSFLDGYGQRLRAFVVAPVTGEYVFWIASDEGSELYLSTDETPAQRTRIARVLGATGYREWNREPGQRSAPIRLEGGRRYFLEALHVEGGGADHLSVRWTLPGGQVEEPLPAVGPGGEGRLIPYDPAELAAPILLVQPRGLTVVQGQLAELTVLAGNRAPVNYQWQSNRVDILGATTSVYRVSSPTVADHDGVRYRCVLSNGNVAGLTTSEEAVLTVKAEALPPAVVSAVSVGNNLVRVAFAEPVESASAIERGHYAITNSAGALGVSAASLSADGKVVVLTTRSQDPGVGYVLTINGVKEPSSQQKEIAPDTQINFTNVVFTLGYIQRQLYFAIPGTSVSNLTNHARYPARPDRVDYPASLGWPVENISDDYGARLAGYLVPPLSGLYLFSIRSDDSSQLFLSTDDQPGNKVLLSREDGCCGGFDAHGSGAVSLQAGRRYYIEALMKESGGSDYAYVAWKTPASSGTWTVIPGVNLGNYLVGSNATVTITRQPTNILNQLPGTAATFSVSATGTSSVTTNLSYQWQRDGVDVPGANASGYTLPEVAEMDDGAVFRVLVTVPGKGVFSSSATLTVQPDTVSPTVASVQNVGLRQLLVRFSERTDAGTMTAPANYTFTNGVTVSAAVAQDEWTVLLTTTPLVSGGSHTLFVSGVQDRARTPNPIVAGTSYTFTAVEFQSGDVGGAAPAGSAIATGGGWDVSGGGSDIGGTADRFQFNYQLALGDFDVRVRVASMTLSDPWAKAGLMARETLEAGSAFAAALATPTMAGCVFESRGSAGAVAVTAGNFPANYPSTWLRLRRLGNALTGLASADGSRWVLLGSATLKDGALWLGYAVTSHNTNQTTTALFRDFGAAGGGSIGSFALPHEPLGPSSRRTGLVLSEIMYKPAARSDGKDLEYVEIYNSNPFFEDISGYSLAGDVAFTFPAGTVLPGGGFLVVARTPADVRGVYEIGNVTGPYAGSLKRSGVVRLVGSGGAVYLSVPYSNQEPWPVGADGTGHSLVLANPSFGEGRAQSWQPSELAGGSPGRREGHEPTPLRALRINEILAHSEPPLTDYIELHNHAREPLDISGCVITDDPATNRFVVPPGTVLGAGGLVLFEELQLGFSLRAEGETLYLKSPDGRLLLDAVPFEAQANGVSSGRFPDGVGDMRPLSVRSPGRNNGAYRVGAVVINEIMYAPISGDPDDEYIELYNAGAADVPLAGWQFAAGINYQFPSNAVLVAGGYLVVARNATNLLARYPGLHAGNTVGNFGGSLSGSGERVALSRPEQHVTANPLGGLRTNLIQVIEDEVTYGTGGRWGNWADGGGSSLELIDPRSDHRLAYSWADSDESAKGEWTSFEFAGPTGETVPAGSGGENLQILLLGPGECLIDDVEVRSANGTNRVPNAGFESGLTGWTLQGSHDNSTIEETGFGGSRSLHIRAGSRGDNGANRIRSGPLTPNASGGIVIGAKARWVRGWPEVLLRLHGGGAEAMGRLKIPRNLGTPGARNSQAATNAGPVIHEVAHYPVLPAGGEPVLVTARVSDPDGIAAFVLRYRSDASPAPAGPGQFESVGLTDDGTGGDDVAGDGVFTAILPAQEAGAGLAFYLEATDALGVHRTFPRDVFPSAPLTRCFPNDAPSRECLVRWGDTQMPGTFPTYHLWISGGTSNRWRLRDNLNNASLDGTFVYNNYRVIYNAKPQFGGSPWHRGAMTDGPAGNNAVDYVMNFHEDSPLLGATDFVLNNPGNPGGSGTSDSSAQSEQTSYLIFRGIGIHHNYRRYVHMFVNGIQRSRNPLGGTGNFVFEDSQQPNSDEIAEFYPDDQDGQMFKVEDWFEFDDSATGFSINDADLARRTVLLNGTQTVTIAPYRFMFRRRSVGTGESANDYTNFFRMLDVVSPTLNFLEPFADLKAVEQNINVDQWMRIIAVQHAIGNWDSYGYQRGKNTFTYRGANSGRFELMTWDIDFTMGVGGHGESQDIFDIGGATANNGGDPRIWTMWNTPAFVRHYWRAFKDIVDGPLNNSYLDPILDAKAAALAANNITVSPDVVATIKSFTKGRRAYIQSRLSGVATNFSVGLPGPLVTSNDTVLVTGSAPIEVAVLKVNGREVPISWSFGPGSGLGRPPTGWSMNLALAPGTNSFALQGYDRLGRPLANAAQTITVVYTGEEPDPRGVVAINEIHYRPRVPASAYVELINTSTNHAFDLSNWRIPELGLVLPEGTVLTNRQLMLVARDRSALISANPSNTTPVTAEFPLDINPDGQTLSLVKPGQPPALDLVVDRMRYEPTLPWPAAAAGGGSALQLIDPGQDHRRVANWSDDYNWRFFSLTGQATDKRLLLYLNTVGDIYLDDISLVAGAEAGVGPNLFGNGGFEGPFTTNVGGPWVLSSPAVSNSVISTAYSHSGTGSLHLIFTAPGGPTVNLFQDIPGVVISNKYTLSFWYLPATNANQMIVRIGNGLRTIVANLGPRGTTPGSVNSVARALPRLPDLWLNEVCPENVTGIASAAGQRPPWIELYNSGTNALGLGGFFLANNYSNLTQWAFASNQVIQPGEFRVVFADEQAGSSSDPEWHTSFGLTPGTGTVALSWVVEDHVQVLDYLTYRAVPPDSSYGDSPDAQPIDRQVFASPTPGTTNGAAATSFPVVINEWMASNTRTLLNAANNNKADDWFELHNRGTNTLELGGHFLTDSLSDPRQFEIPPGYRIGPRGYLLVWADGATNLNQGNRPELHVNFQLSRAGEMIGLFAADGSPVDVVTFGLQTNDVSEGRAPNGGGIIRTLAIPTPGAPNSAARNGAPFLAAISDRTIYLGETLNLTVVATDPDLPGQSLRYALQAGPQGAVIGEDSGVLSWTPTAGQAPGTNTIQVRVLDNGTPALGATQTMRVVVFQAPELALNKARPGVTFNALSNRLYSVEWKESLDYGRWTKLRDIPSQPTDRVELVTDPNPLADGRLYRLVTPRQPDSPKGPLIVRSPRSAIVDPGERVVLSLQAVATGTDPLSYEWFLNGIAVAGATSSNLVIAAAQLADSGLYSVRVRDQSGVTTNQPPAVVAVRPRIVDQPQGRSAVVGETVTLSVTAIGTDPLRYQWTRNGRPLPGANASTLVLVNVQAADAGTYQVSVSHPTLLGQAGVLSQKAELILSETR